MQKWTHLEICLVRIESEDGVVGWGEAFGYTCLTATVAAVRNMLAPVVVGRTISDVASFNKELQLKMHIFGRYGITMFAISGIDIALWDLAAKKCGVSLAQLLGGRVNEKIAAYASLVRYGEPAKVESVSRKAIEEGYNALKLHEITVENVAASRRAAPDAIITTDINCNWSREEAERLLPEMKKLGLYWVEEPLFPPDDTDELSDLYARFGVNLASGENACTMAQFKRICNSVSFPQPSVTKVGGVTEFFEIAKYAASLGKKVMPHCPYFGPGWWATLQLACALPQCELVEMLYIVAEKWLMPDIPLPHQGYIHVPNRLGLGFEPDPEVLRSYSAEAAVDNQNWMS
jgi:L-alanine-DL-glutamate epimerase-like enolase superfamily enzyme